MPEAESDETLSESFVNFFLGKITKIRDNLDQFDKFNPLVNPVDVEFDEFRMLHKDDIIKLVHKLQTKSCELDLLPTYFIKENFEQFVGILNHIVNASLSEGCFYHEWKTAVLRPLLKKPDLELID